MGATKTAGSAGRDDAMAAFPPKDARPRVRGPTGPATGTDVTPTPFHKVLFCLSGSIVFHTDDGDVELTAGDRLDLPPDTAHAATVGSAGCGCVEGSR